MVLFVVTVQVFSCVRGVPGVRVPKLIVVVLQEREMLGVMVVVRVWELVSGVSVLSSHEAGSTIPPASLRKRMY